MVTVKMPCPVHGDVPWNETNCDCPLFGTGKHVTSYGTENYSVFFLRCVFKWDFALSPALYILLQIF